MKIKDFLKRFKEAYDGLECEVQFNHVLVKGELCVKFYAQVSTFSFVIYFFKEGEVHNFIDKSKIIAFSEIYDDWIEEGWTRKAISVELETRLKTLQSTNQDRE